MKKKIAENNPPVNGAQKKPTQFATVEAYKMIRTNLLFLLSQSKEKSITVSSAGVSEGKSTSAINIAVVFSQLGRRVLLIDADMRKPSVHKNLHLSNKNGLGSILAGFSSLEEATTNVGDNLDVITAGPTPPNPSELLGSQQMADLLEKLNEIYDYIIIDTPPVNTVPDALIVAPRTSGILFVVRDFVTPHAEFQKALSSIEFAGVRMLGVVLNASSANNMKRSYKYDAYHYDSYHGE